MFGCGCVELCQPFGCAHIGPAAGVELGRDALLRHAGAQLVYQGRLYPLGVARGDVAPRPRKQRSAVQADGAVGVAGLGIVGRQVQGQAHVAAVGRNRQTKVTLWVMRWVGDQPQVGQLAAGPEPVYIGLAEHKVGCKHVARQHPKHAIGLRWAQKRQRPGNATRGLQCAAKIAAFVGVLNVDGVCLMLLI